MFRSVVIILKLRPYIVGTKFTTDSDHNPIRWLMSIEDPVRRLMPWILRLSPFDVSIIHRLGQSHQVPDAVPRLRREKEPSYPSADEAIPNFEYATVLAVRTISWATADVNPELDYGKIETIYVTDDDVGDLIDE